MYKKALFKFLATKTTTTVDEKTVEEKRREEYVKVASILKDKGILPQPSVFGKKIKSTVKNPLWFLVHQVAGQEWILKRRKEILSPEDFELLWSNLSRGDECDRFVDYLEFKEIKQALPEKFHPHFNASTFLKLTRNGQVSIIQFYNYILRKVSLHQARLDLGEYDTDKDGYLTEEELETYILDMIPELHHLSEMSMPFERFYVCICSRKFMFFLDPMRRGTLKIQSIVSSPLLTEFFQLKEPGCQDENNYNGVFGGEMDTNTKIMLQSNWFSFQSSMKFYNMFLSLDADRNGMLSRQEMTSFKDNSLSEVILDRLFQETQTFNGELDFKGFLDFVLACEYIQDPMSYTYWFKLLDVYGQNSLDSFTVRYLFQSVLERMEERDMDHVEVDDVVNEVLDMAGVEHKITLKDLQKCGLGGTIVSILIDCKGFYSHEHPDSPVDDIEEDDANDFEHDQKPQDKNDGCIDNF